MDRNIDFIQVANSIVHLDSLIPQLIKDGVYSEAIIKSKQAAYTSVQMQTLHIVLDLKTKGPKTLEKFYQCLIAAEEYNAAKNMNSSFQIPEKQIINIKNDTIQKAIELLPSNQQDTKKIEECDGGIYVRPAKELIDDQNHNPPIYRMKSSPKGHALVIVNLKFSRNNYRVGADKDFQMLTQLFMGLGYRVHAHINKTCQDMRYIISSFATGLDHSCVDSCIVAISTHGNGACLLGSDSKGLPRTDVVESFNNKLCPDLCHKPKLFFFQACRGDRYDEGIEDDTDGGGGSSTKIALFTDMWIFSSTIPEYVSWRNAKGSWFIVAITEIFAEHAWNTPLSQLYTKVDERMETLEALNRDGNKQVAELAVISWRKDLYFNPGKCETVSVKQIRQQSSA